MTTAGKTTSRPPAVGSRGDALYGLKCGICAFVVFALCLLIRCSQFSEISKATTSMSYYLLDYSLGFNSRFFIGSIISLLTRNVTWEFIYCFIVFSLIVLCAVFAAWLGRVMSETTRENRFGATILFTMLLASPSSITFMFREIWIGRFDPYLTLFAILICVCAPRRRLCWLVPPLCLLAIMTNHVFFMIFMPYIGIIMLYEMYRHAYSKKYAAIFILTVLLTTAAAIYFRFLQYTLSPIEFSNATEFADYISRTRAIETPFMDALINFEYFVPLSDTQRLTIIPIIKQIWWKYPLSFVVSQFPALCVFFLLWKGSLGDKADKIRRLIGILCLISPLTLTVTCAGANDWSRWFNLTLLAHFILAFYFIFRGDDTVLSRVRQLGEFFRAKPALLVASVCYSAMFTFSDLQQGTYLFYDDMAIFELALSLL